MAARRGRVDLGAMFPSSAVAERLPQEIRATRNWAIRFRAMMFHSGAWDEAISDVVGFGHGVLELESLAIGRKIAWALHTGKQARTGFRSAQDGVDRHAFRINRQRIIFVIVRHTFAADLRRSSFDLHGDNGGRLDLLRRAPAELRGPPGKEAVHHHDK